MTELLTQLEPGESGGQGIAELLEGRTGHCTSAKL